MSNNLYMPTQSSAAASGVASAGAGMLGEVLQDDDPTDKGSVGKAALGGAAKGAAAGLAFGPWGAAIGGVVGGAVGFFKGKKAQKEGIAANAETDQQEKIARAISDNTKSIQANQSGKDIASASMNPAYGKPVFNPQQANTIKSVFDPNQQTSVV